MNRAVLALVVALPLGVGSAAAASLGPITAGALGAGDATVGRCDTAFTVAYLAPTTPPATPANPIDRVEISDVAAACGGGGLSLVVVDGSRRSWPAARPPSRQGAARSP